MLICIAEDRASCEVAVKLLLLSITRHCPDMPVELFYPPANAAFKAWLTRCPHVHLNSEPFHEANGFNVKPKALLTLYDRGYTDVVWVDSDIIVTRDIRFCFDNLLDDTLVAAEEALHGAYEDTDALRARAWGFEVGRVLPCAVNSCVVRVTIAHRALVERWRELLEDRTYREAQSLDWSKRPTHLYGDQDVLTALLTCREFASIPFHFLQRGRDIIQYFGPRGYTIRERLGHLTGGMPPFIHSQVNKPWLNENNDRPTDARERFYQLYYQLSPYTLQAEKYKKELESDSSWMRARTRSGKILRILGLNYSPLVGLPMAAVADGLHMTSTIIKKLSRPTASEQGRK